MTSLIVTLACLAALFFCVFLCIKAWNRPKVESELNERMATRADRRDKFFNRFKRK